MSLSHSGGSKQHFLHFHRIFAKLAPASRLGHDISRFQDNFFPLSAFKLA
jgi:hypothetical protein